MGDGIEDKHIAFLNSISELCMNDIVTFNKKNTNEINQS